MIFQGKCSYDLQKGGSQSFYSWAPSKTLKSVVMFEIRALETLLSQLRISNEIKRFSFMPQLFCCCQLKWCDRKSESYLPRPY